MKLLKYTLLSLGVAALAAAASSCGEIKRGEYVDGSAKLFCDDGFRNVLEEEIEVFEYTYPNASIIPFYMSESDAMDSLLNDKCQGVIVTHELTKEDRDYLKAKYKRVAKCQPIAVDAVALIVNKDNPVTAIDMQQIKALLNGELTNWNQLAGTDTTKVQIVFDSQGSSTVSYMRDKFLPKGKLISENPNARAQKNNAEVFDVVKKNPRALGIISVSWLGDYLENAKNIPMDKKMQVYENPNDTVASRFTTEVKVLKVSNPTAENDFDPVAYAPYQVYINSGEYPLFRKVYMISSAPKSSVMNSFYSFVTGFVGQKIISMTGIMPWHVNRRVVQLRGNDKK